METRLGDGEEKKMETSRGGLRFIIAMDIMPFGLCDSLHSRAADKEGHFCHGVSIVFIHPAWAK